MNFYVSIHSKRKIIYIVLNVKDAQLGYIKLLMFCRQDRCDNGGMNEFIVKNANESLNDSKWTTGIQIQIIRVLIHQKSLVPRNPVWPRVRRVRQRQPRELQRQFRAQQLRHQVWQRQLWIRRRQMCQHQSLQFDKTVLDHVMCTRNRCQHDPLDQNQSRRH